MARKLSNLTIFHVPCGTGLSSLTIGLENTSKTDCNWETCTGKLTWVDEGTAFDYAAANAPVEGFEAVSLSQYCFRLVNKNKPEQPPALKDGDCDIARAFVCSYEMGVN